MDLKEKIYLRKRKLIEIDFNFLKKRRNRFTYSLQECIERSWLSGGCQEGSKHIISGVRVHGDKTIMTTGKKTKPFYYMTRLPLPPKSSFNKEKK